MKPFKPIIIESDDFTGLVQQKNNRHSVRYSIVILYRQDVIFTDFFETAEKAEKFLDEKLTQTLVTRCLLNKIDELEKRLGE